MNPPMSSQYRPQYPPQRSPHASAARRGPGPMVGAGHPQGPVSPAHAQAQQHAAAQERELAKRRSRKPMDKNMPDGVQELVVGDGVQRYKEMRELERKLDAAMIRKRLDIQDAVNRNVKRYKTLRLSISNAVENQPWQSSALDENAFDFSPANQPTYRVKIAGTLLDDETDQASDDRSDADDAADGGDKNVDAMDHDGVDTPQPKDKMSDAARPRSKFAHFFKSITIAADPTNPKQPDTSLHIEWKKPVVPPNAVEPPPAADFEMLEFERKSDENINCYIRLVRDEVPERFRLSKELADVLDREVEDRAGVVMGIWEYVKAMGLQEDDEKRSIRCDERLRAVFKQDQVFFPHVPELILQQNHLLPLLPIKLPYTIRVDPEFHADPQPTVYDIRVPLDDPLRSRLTALITDPGYPATLREIAALDDRLALLVQAVARAKAKHGFFTAMSKDPAAFVRRWTSSQKRDLEVILGEATRGGNGAAGQDDGAGQAEEWRKGGAEGVWGTPGVRESVELWLSRGR